MNTFELVCCAIFAILVVLVVTLSAGRFLTALECNEKGGAYVRDAIGFGGKCVQ